MGEPAAKKAKVEENGGQAEAATNGIFQRHAVALILDYGSQYTQLSE